MKACRKTIRGYLAAYAGLLSLFAWGCARPTSEGVSETDLSPSPRIVSLLERCTVVLAVAGEDRGLGAVLDADACLLITTTANVAQQGQLNCRVGDAVLSGKVVFRDRRRGLAMIRVDQLPAGVEPAVPAEKGPALGLPLHTLRAAAPGGWQPVSGRIRQALQRPHECHDEERTIMPWHVMMSAPSPFGEEGGPVVNDAAQLVGIVGPRDAGVSTITRLIDVNEVRAVLADFRALR